jgi:hypothetical protein
VLEPDLGREFAVDMQRHASTVSAGRIITGQVQAHCDCIGVICNHKLAGHNKTEEEKPSKESDIRTYAGYIQQTVNFMQPDIARNGALPD